MNTLTNIFLFKTTRYNRAGAGEAPIYWEGTVGGKKVKFTQIVKDSLGLESFDWKEFPLELENVKPNIAESINNAMRTMD